MSLLTDEELWAIVPNADNLNDAKAVQAAILAKLASAELPDIELTNLWDHMLAWHQAETKDCEKHADAATAVINSQLRQAYAQGAAAQLAEKPSAWKWKVNRCHQHLAAYPPPADAYDEGTLIELYTRRQA